MKSIVQNPSKEEPMQVYPGDHPAETAIRSSPNRNRFRLLPWLAGILFIFTLLYQTSYLALLWLPPFEGVDTRSQLTADYGVWEDLVFQPVDPAIIEEIRKERGLPNQIFIEGAFWPTPTSAGTRPPIAGQTSIPTGLATSSLSPSNPTASQFPYSSTPAPTSTVSVPEFTLTVQPTGTPNPTEARPPKTRKTRKPHKTPKPKSTGNH